MNPDSRFYADAERSGVVEYQPASVTYVHKVDLPGYPWTCRLYITCSIGCAPRVAIDFGAGDFGMATRSPLSLEQWNRLREAVADCWGALEIRCTCGHPFGRHTNDSPHGCAFWSADRRIAGSGSGEGPRCPCTRFAASEPLVDERNQLREAK